MNNAIIARLCGLTVLISACILSFSIGNGCEENDEEITSVDYEPRAALIQVGGAAFNKANTKRWKQLGIKTPDELRKIGPSFLVRDFMGLDRETAGLSAVQGLDGRQVPTQKAGM
jgi:hypothetical protein